MIIDVAIGVFLGLVAFSILPTVGYFLFFSAQQAHESLREKREQNPVVYKPQSRGYEEPIPEITAEQLRVLKLMVVLFSLVAVGILISFIIK